MAKNSKITKSTLRGLRLAALIPLTVGLVIVIIGLFQQNEVGKIVLIAAGSNVMFFGLVYLVTYAWAYRVWKKRGGAAKQTHNDRAGDLIPDNYEESYYNPETMTEAQKSIYNGYFAFVEEKGGCIFKRRKNKEMTEDEYLAAIAEKIREMNVQQRALNKLGLDISQVSEIEPKEFRNFYYESGVLLKDGNSSKFQVTWLFFSGDQVFVYDLIFDMCNDSETESCLEYFYKDITCVYAKDTVKEVTALDVSLGGCLRRKPKVDESKGYIKTTGFYIVVPGDEFHCSMRAGNHVRDMVFAMKQKIREKKAN